MQANSESVIHFPVKECVIFRPLFTVYLVSYFYYITLRCSFQLILLYIQNNPSQNARDHFQTML